MRKYQMQNQTKRAQMADYQAARRAYKQNPDAKNKVAMQQKAKAVMAQWQQRW